MTDLQDVISQRLAANNQVQTNNPTVGSQLPGTYYSGTQSYATMNPTARLQAQVDGQSQLASQVGTIMQGKLQDASIARAQKQAADALAAQQKANAAAQAQYNIGYNSGLTAAQQKFLKGLAPGKGSGSGASVSGTLFGKGSSGSYTVTGNHANTSGARGAIGGVRGSGTYKYVNNTKLDAQRNKVLALATSYLGTPYKLGGESHTAIDCSGLVQLVYRAMGFKVPTHSAADQGQTGGRHNGNGIPGVKTSVSNLQPGDLVAWKDGSHIAIYAGNGMIIEAANPVRGTEARKLYAPLSDVVGIHVTFKGE